MASLRSKDVLAARGRIDKSGFMLFAFGGSTAIISAKAFGVPGNWVAIGAVLAMALYAILQLRGGVNRLRADHAGDNCYYLGLVYTLASLSHAIATFNPDDSASGIVQSFGVALATTIVGLVLRVWFNQARPDLENVEERSRLELSEAVTRLKSQLSDCVRQFNDFSREIQQSITELKESVSEDIEQTTEDAINGIQQVVEEASNAIRQEASDFAARSKRYTTTFDRLLAKLDQHTAAAEELVEAQEGMKQMAATASEAAVAAAAAAKASHETAENGHRTSSAVREEMAGLQSVTSGLAESVGVLHTALQAMQAQVDQQIESLRGGPGSAVFEVSTALSRSAQELRAHLAEAGKVHAEAHAGLTARTEEALQTTRQLNERLQKEVDRSSDLVIKVHDALADMTSRLADAVESGS